MNAPSTFLEWALEYARREWPVFPCFPKTKTPFGNSKKPPGPRNLVPNGHKDATTDPAKIREWWGAHPNANIGIAMGRASGLVTTDIDGGEKLLTDFQSMNGSLPPTGMMAKTGRKEGNGFHVVHRIPKDHPTKIEGIITGVLDIKADGGYIVVAPSVHPDGPSYEWLSFGEPGDIDPAQVEKLRAFIADKCEVGQNGQGVVDPQLVAASRKLLQERPDLKAIPPLHEGAGNVRTLDPYVEGNVERLRSALAVVAEQTPKRITERKSWLAIGMGLHELMEHNWPEAIVRKVWDDASIGAGFAALKDEAERDKDWNSFGRSYTGRKTTVGTIYRWARDLKWQDPREQDQATYFTPLGHDEPTAPANGSAASGTPAEPNLLEQLFAAQGMTTAGTPLDLVGKPGSGNGQVHDTQRQALLSGVAPGAFLTPDSVRWDGAAPGGKSLGSTCGGDMKPELIEWFWEGRLAKRKITLEAGHPDHGKSAVCADIAARCTTGAPWPDGKGHAPKGPVLILTAEDGPKDTWLPRLIAAGADLSQVHFITMTRMPGKGERVFNLRDDLDVLDAKCRALNPVLIIIDPLSAYMGDPAKVDTHKEGDVRTTLAPLEPLLERHNAAILAIKHLTKGNVGSGPLQQISGAAAFGALVRVAIWVGADPSPGASPDRKLFLVMKNNIGRRAPGLAYKIGVKVVPDLGEQPFIDWDPTPVSMTAEQVHVAQNHDGRRKPNPGINFLRDFLADGPRKTKVVEEAAGEQMITIRTLERARAELGVKAFKQPGVLDGDWFLKLPGQTIPPKDAAPEKPGKESKK